MKRQAVGSRTRTLCRASFVNWLDARIAAGETRADVGWELGVTGACVSRWIQGRCGVSDTAMLLAEHLRRGAVDLAPGLPEDSLSDGG